MAFYAINDLLRSNIDHQGLVRGREYRVVGVNEGKWGTVTYDLFDPISRFTVQVVNAHVLLSKVDHVETTERRIIDALGEVLEHEQVKSGVYPWLSFNTENESGNTATVTVDGVDYKLTVTKA